MPPLKRRNQEFAPRKKKSNVHKTLSINGIPQGLFHVYSDPNIYGDQIALEDGFAWRESLHSNDSSRVFLSFNTSGEEFDIIQYIDPFTNSNYGERIMRELDVYQNKLAGEEIVVKIHKIWLPIIYARDELQDKIRNFEFVDVYILREFYPVDLDRYLKQWPLPPPMSDRKSLMRKLLDTVRSLHEKGIIHMDLNPNNVVVVDPKLGGLSKLKLRNFGLSKDLGKETDLFHVYDSSKPIDTKLPIYSAPEVILGWWHCDDKVDVWSLGCMFAQMLRGNGLAPFNLSRGKYLTPENLQAVISVVRGTEEQKSKFLRSITSDLDAQDLLSKMLEFNPVNRISVENARFHKYFEVEVEASCTTATTSCTTTTTPTSSLGLGEAESSEDEGMEDSAEEKMRKRIRRLKKTIWKQMKCYDVLLN